MLCARAKARAPRGREAGDWKLALEGAEMCWKDYSFPDGRRYMNYKIRCTNPDHPASCKTTRGDLDQYKLVEGAIEPLAFCLAWLPLEPDGNKPHSRMHPSAADVSAYAAAHREELWDLRRRLQPAGER